MIKKHVNTKIWHLTLTKTWKRLLMEVSVGAVAVCVLLGSGGGGRLEFQCKVVAPDVDWSGSWHILGTEAAAGCLGSVCACTRELTWLGSAERSFLCSPNVSCGWNWASANVKFVMLKLFHNILIYWNKFAFWKHFRTDHMLLLTKLCTYLDLRSVSPNILFLLQYLI